MRLYGWYFSRAAVDPAADVDALVGGFTNAGVDLMRPQAANDNLVFSPISIGDVRLIALTRRSRTGERTTHHPIRQVVDQPLAIALHLVQSAGTQSDRLP